MTWLVALMLAATPLEAAQKACEDDYRACDARDKLQREQTAQQAAQASEREAAGQAFREQQLANALAEEQAEVDRMKKRCGKDYMRVRVGMKFDRARQCAGPFSLRYADGSARVYEAAGGLVRVEGGRVTRAFYRR